MPGSVQHLFSNQTMRYLLVLNAPEADKASPKKQPAGDTVGICLPESVIKELLGFRDRKFDVTVRPGDNVYRDKFTDPLGGCTAGVRSCFYRTDITAHKHCYQTAAHKLPANELHFSSLNHCIGSLNGAHHTSGFYHT
jgi:hypothetical protein